MAAVKALVPVEEYPDTVYEPDCDYFDGELVVGTWETGLGLPARKGFMKFAMEC